MKNNNIYSYWKIVWHQFCQHRIGLIALIVVLLFCLMGIYAPFLASSKPLIVSYGGDWYFPLFRYLFYRGFFTKRLDLFYNLLIFSLPLFILAWTLLKNRTIRLIVLVGIVFLHFIGFIYIAFKTPQDPEANPQLTAKRQKYIQNVLLKKKVNSLLSPPVLFSWEDELNTMTPYAKLNLLLKYIQKKEQEERLSPYAPAYTAQRKKEGDTQKTKMPTLWNLSKENEKQEIVRQQAILDKYMNEYPQAKSLMQLLHQQCQPFPYLKNITPWMMCDFLVKLSAQDKKTFEIADQTVNKYEQAEARLKFIENKNTWLEAESLKLKYEVMPLIRPFHWEDDAGGSQNMNRVIPWWELTRINRKDMVAALIFGVRISLTVGLTAVAIALMIGIPIGAMSGYYGGKIDIITYRLIEIWESMPTFFMLLMIIAFLQNKSIFIVVGIIGFFGWTGFSRFVRGEFFRQKQLPYVEACRAMGFNDSYIMFSHLLPNAIPPLLTLVPFAIMGAITSEAGLSFLGLGEEGSCSWGVLMDEGRTAFPAESYLLWPPAILLTIFLVSIALVGDALRDAMDPKLHFER